MTKLGKRRSSSVEHRSTKRRKPDSENHTIYSTRVVTWAEQLTLPKRFHEEKNVWPALRILEERGTGRRREFLLEWEAHPKTGELFEPTWEPADNVGQELKYDWRQAATRRRVSTRSQSTSPITTSGFKLQTDVPKRSAHNRRAYNRRVIPDSSAETEEPIIEDSASSRTPTLTGSPGSLESLPSPLEIPETQRHPSPVPIRVDVPPAPEDKSDWESLRESQFSNYGLPNHHSSPVSNSGPRANPDSLQSATPSTAGRATAPAPSTTGSSTTRSSLRLRTFIEQKRRSAPQRILDYQSSEQSLLSPTEQLIFSTAPAEQSDPVPDEDERRHDSVKGHIHSARREKGKKLFENRQETCKGDDSLLESISDSSPLEPATQPWVFKSQISRKSLPASQENSSSFKKRTLLSGRCARKTSDPSSQESSLSFSNRGGLLVNTQLSPETGMAARGTRQSPRLQTATPQSSVAPPRIAVRTGSFRARSNFNPPEHSSPLAATAELAEPSQDSLKQNLQDNLYINTMASEQNSSNMQTIPTSIAPSAMHIDPTESSILGSLSQDSLNYDAALNTLPSLVQESIEEEPTSSAEEASLASKASSSQESLRNERLVPQVDGLVMPTYPILSEDEYAIALPAEGKVQAIYTQTVKVKRKAILKFIRRRGSVNTASTSTYKTIERNEMIELIGRLHDTTTHIDLGLPGIPTQYTIPSQEHATYAEYAGSKFVFLGYLLDLLQRRQETIVIMAKSGATQDLLEEYLYMKNVNVRRHEKEHKTKSLEDDRLAIPQVELLTTRANTIVELDTRPSLIIAFDASFEALDPQVKSLKARSTTPLPTLHLLVTNSSEHVERCLPISMPSPIRLRLLVRATYQAHMNLGGSPTIITNPSDEMDGRPMDLGDINRAVRKSPNRRLQMVAAVVANAVLSDDFAANWTLSTLPELVLEEIDESPSTDSTVSATPARTRNRSQTPVSKAASQVRTSSQTPISRAGTPTARKRQLEVDTTGIVPKRQRMTPVNEVSDVRDNDVLINREQELLRMFDALRAELANEKKARELAEAAKDAAEKKAAEWQLSLAALQRRYEKRTQKSHEQQKANKSLTLTLQNGKTRMDKTALDNATLREKIVVQGKELEQARADLKSAGGDVASLEVVREEARNATTKALVLEKSLDNTKRDFEFLRHQYQDASNRAAELGSQVSELEARITTLTKQASDEKVRLKEMNQAATVKQHLAKIQQLEDEKRNIQVMYKKLEEESKLLKRNRGVQTRGSSTTPGTPGQRSRQGSPAAGNLAPPSGSRASVLRHER